MANTPNLDLVKPEPLDPGTQDTWAFDLNDNFEKIDGAFVIATISSPGLMSASDKSKLDGIATGAQVNPDPALVSAIRSGTGDGYLSPTETWAAQEPVELNPANPDLGSGINFKLTLTANTTLADPIGARLGQEGPISIFRAGSETLSFGPAWRGFGNIDLPAEAGKGAEMQFRVVSVSPVVVRFSVVQEA